MAADGTLAARKQLRLDPLGLAGGLLLLTIGLGSAAAPALTSADPMRVDLLAQFAPASAAHPLGTDGFGRDIWARLLYGGRASLAVALLASSIVLALALVLGSAAGYLGGVVDLVLTRLADLTLAFPRLVLAIALAGLLGGGLVSAAAAIVAVSWAWYARIVRAMVLQLREEPYVLASRALGAPAHHVLRRHIVPAVAGRVAVLASLDFGYLILNVSALSFLGLGVQQPTPEWGAMLSEGRLFFPDRPDLMLYPGLAIFLTVLAANLLGDALRDLLDPRSRRA